MESSNSLDDRVNRLGECRKEENPFHFHGGSTNDKQDSTKEIFVTLRTWAVAFHCSSSFHMWIRDWLWNTCPKTLRILHASRSSKVQKQFQRPAKQPDFSLLVETTQTPRRNRSGSAPVRSVKNLDDLRNGSTGPCSPTNTRPSAFPFYCGNPRRWFRRSVRKRNRWRSSVGRFPSFGEVTAAVFHENMLKFGANWTATCLGPPSAPDNAPGQVRRREQREKPRNMNRWSLAPRPYWITN